MIPVEGAASGDHPVEYALLIREDTMFPEAIAFEVHYSPINGGTPEAILNGDYVFVDTSQTDLASWKVHLTEHPDQGFMVKRLRRGIDALWVMSGNPTNGSSPAKDAVRAVGQAYSKLSFGWVS